MEDIINVIDDIAFQTNLLALNAAVEAARAGEMQRCCRSGGAVRSLAQRSAISAKEISGLIQESTIQIQSGAKIADRSGVVLKSIVSVRKPISLIVK